MSRTANESEAQIAEVVQKFESCSYRPEEFTHTRHLTVACWYLETCTTTAEATTRMRRGLQHFIQHYGKNAYHETITRFWMIVLGQALVSAPLENRVARIEWVVAQHSDKNLLYRYYSRDRVLSNEAKEHWLQPDLRTIEDDIL